VNPKERKYATPLFGGAHPGDRGRTRGRRTARTQDHFLEGKLEGGARALLTLHRTGGRGDNRRAFARTLWTLGRSGPGRVIPFGVGATPARVAMRVRGLIPACCSRIRGGRALLALFGVRSRLGVGSRGGGLPWCVATSGGLGVFG
jgi:hypothetical protein